MSVKKIFKATSAQLLAEFQKSSNFKHSGNKGDFREESLKKFLSETRFMPRRYGVAKGEIINPNEQRSKQCDLVIYNQLDGITFLGGDSSDIIPIESVYGVIEVKSSLSKDILLEGLENIKSVKQASYEENLMVSPVPGIVSCIERPKPFGIIFAYSLSNNSIVSLTENLADWHKNNEQRYCPELIVILNEGIICHDARSKPIYKEYKEDTLFYFCQTACKNDPFEG